MVVAVQEAKPQNAVKFSAGDQAPAFSLNVHPKGKSSVQKTTLASYKGRWLAVEFWTKTCISCIKGFPKLQMLSDSLKGEMDFLLVGKNDEKYNSGIMAMYQRISAEENLTLDIAFDTLSFKSFGVWATPHAVIISPDGRIASISVGSELSLTALRALMKGNTGQIAQLDGTTSRKAAQAANPDITENSGTNPHSSKLYYWQKGEATSGARDIATAYKNGIFVSRLSSLSQLYLLSELGKSIWDSRDSLYGRVWPKPLLELADTSNFEQSYQRAKGLFSYRVKMSDSLAPTSLVQPAMRSDLKQWFGYSAAILEKEMPVLQLVTISTTAKSALKSKGGAPEISGDYGSLQLRNLPIERLRLAISSYFPHHVVIEQTGISATVDLSLQGSLTDLASLRRALQQHGLDLLPATKMMKVLVLSDPK